jgi:hypothetical protein
MKKKRFNTFNFTVHFIAIFLAFILTGCGIGGEVGDSNEEDGGGDISGDNGGSSSSLPEWKSIGPSNITIDVLGTQPQTSEAIFIVGTDLRLAKTEDGGASWIFLDNSPSSISAIAFSHQDPLTLFAIPTSQGMTGKPNIQQYYYIYRSKDGGLSWEWGAFIECKKWSCEAGLTDLLIDENNPDHILVSTVGVQGGPDLIVRTVNGGVRWDSIIEVGGYTAMAADPTNSNVVYAGAYHGWVWRFGGVWGPALLEKITPNGVSLGNIKDIEVDLNSHVYVATSDEGVKKWDGSVWRQIHGLPEDNISSLATDRDVNPEAIYAGTSKNGVFVSDDGGSTWTSFNDGLVNLEITKLALGDAQPKRLYAGTKNGGVWSIDVSSLGGGS